jgi:hypothetical protein
VRQPTLFCHTSPRLLLAALERLENRDAAQSLYKVGDVLLEKKLSAVFVGPAITCLPHIYSCEAQLRSVSFFLSETASRSFTADAELVGDAQLCFHRPSCAVA